MILDLASSLDICSRAPGASWGWGELASTLGLWQVMIAAMMAPVVAPWLVAMARQPGGAASLPGFLTGYALVWAMSGLAVTACQWGFTALAPRSNGLVITNPIPFALLFMAVGLYQWLPVKDACLRHCQSPMSFMLSHWRDGVWGAVWMGARHGLHCIGCCWPLMLLLILTGAMGLAWMAMATAIALAEMYLPCGKIVARAFGAALAGVGAALILGLAIA